MYTFSTDSDAVNRHTADSQESTALHMAAQSGHQALVSSLLSHPRINLNVTDSKLCTPLHLACLHGHTSVVLVLQDADFCLMNHEGDLPLHIAAANSHTNIFLALKDCEPFGERYRSDDHFVKLKVRSTLYIQSYTVVLIIINTHCCRSTTTIDHTPTIMGGGAYI